LIYLPRNSISQEVFFAKLRRFSAKNFGKFGDVIK
jgi:hypothetical protein